MLVIDLGEASGASSTAGSQEVAIHSERSGVLNALSNESRPVRPKSGKDRPVRDNDGTDKGTRPKKPKPDKHPQPPPTRQPRIHPMPAPYPVVHQEVLFIEHPYHNGLVDTYGVTEIAGTASTALAIANGWTLLKQDSRETLSITGIVFGAGTITTAFATGQAKSWSMAAGITSFIVGWAGLIAAEEPVAAVSVSF